MALILVNSVGSYTAPVTSVTLTGSSGAAPVEYLDRLVLINADGSYHANVTHVTNIEDGYTFQPTSQNKLIIVNSEGTYYTKIPENGYVSGVAGISSVVVGNTRVSFLGAIYSVAQNYAVVSTKGKVSLTGNIRAVSGVSSVIITSAPVPQTIDASLDTNILFDYRLPLSISLDSSVNFSGIYIDKLTGLFSTTLSLDSSFFGISGIVSNSFFTGINTEVSFAGIVGVVADTNLSQDTSTYFSLVSGSAGSFGVNLSTDVLFSSGIIGNVVVDAVTDIYFSGFAAIIGTILLTSDFECTLISPDNIIFDVGQEDSDTSTDIKEPDAFVMNLSSSGVSQYSNYKFDSIFFFDGAPYGCNSSGIFKLIGNADGVSGEDVEIPVAIAVAKTAISDFNTQKMKSARDSYAYIRSSGDMLISVATNEQVERNNYPLYYDGIDGIHSRRVKIAQGLRGTSWQVSIKNDSGADFTIKQVDIIPVELDRSI